MKKRLLSILLCLVMALSLLPIASFAGEGTPLTELHITGPASVTAGKLPAITADVVGGDHASVEHNYNSRWRKLPIGESWQDLDSADPIAVNDGSTRYGMVLCVDVESGYAITSDTKIYYNGTEVPDSIGRIYPWGTYVLIDLGKAVDPAVPVSYTVTFETYGGAPVPETQTVAAGEKAVKPADPSKGTDLVFGGWFTDTTFTTKFDFDTPITANTTVFARWTENTPSKTPVTKVELTVGSPTAGKTAAECMFVPAFTTTPAGAAEFWVEETNWYNRNGNGKFTGTFEDGKEYINEIVLKCKEGYTFPVSGGEYLGTVVVNGKDAYYAEASNPNGQCAFIGIVLTTAGIPAPAAYTVTFNMNGHGDQISAQTIAEGNKASKPADPAASGFTFGGWFTDTTFTTKFDFDTPITANTTVFARWTKNLTAITKIEITVPKPIAGKTGDAVGKVPTIKTVPADAIEAHDGDWWNISDGNYFKGAFEAGKSYSFGINIAPKDGYWFECDGDRYLGEIVVNGGTFEYTESDGTIVFLSTVVECEGSAAPDAEKFTVSVEVWDTENHKWIGGRVSLKTKDPETGHWADSGYACYAEKGETVEIRAQAAEGYTFVEWVKDDENFSTFSKDAEYAFTASEKIDLYAVFRKNDAASEACTVTFNMNGHGTQITAQTVESGSKAAKPADPAASGYTFDGWYTDTTFSAAFDFDTPITANTTVFAKWTEAETDAPAVTTKTPDPTEPADKQTDGNSHIFLWIVLLLVIGGAAAGAVYYFRIKKSNAK